MSRPSKSKALPIAAVLLAVGGPVSAQLSFTENFSTTTYRDAINTTADWNTAAGEIRLFPFAMSSAGSFATAGTAVGIAVSGNLAFVAADPNVVILNIANPAVPTLLGTFVTTDAQAVDPEGDVLYVAGGTAGLRIVNVTNPAAPVQLGFVDTPDVAWDVTVEGDIAYVANGVTGLLVFDVSNVAAPVQIGSYNTPGTALRVDVAGDYCFVADRTAGGLLILDITDPTTPTYVANILLPGDTWSVVVDGDLAYVALGAAGLTIVDVSDPSAPVQLGTVDPGSVRQFSVSGDIVYASGVTLTHVIDVSNPNSPVLVTSWDNPGTSSDAVLAGRNVFVADGASGVLVLLVRLLLDPPVEVASVNTSGTPRRVAVAGDHAFIADGSSGLLVLDISDPAGPFGTDVVDTPLDANDVQVAGDYAFVADLNSLRVMDISSPSAVVEVASTPVVANAYRSVTLAGNYALVAGAELRVINIEDPTNPVVEAVHGAAVLSRSVAVAGNYAFWAQGGGIEVVDISNPAAPVTVFSLDTAGEPNSIAVAGDFGYVAGSSGVQRIDISNPASPAGGVGVGSTASAFVTIAGDYVYWTDATSGGPPGSQVARFRILNISNPSSPGATASIVPGGIGGIAVHGHHALVCNGSDGVKSFRVFQDEIDPTRTQGQSLAVDGGTATIVKIRLTATQTTGVDWSLSTNNGVGWTLGEPDGQWRTIFAGSDLKWRTQHHWSEPGVNPTVSDLQLQWRVQNAIVADIADVPDDQGGEVRIAFTRSGYDFADEATTFVTGYQVYQRVDAAAAAVVTANNVPDSPLATDEAWAGIDASRRRAVGERRFVVGPIAAAAGTFPPGVWEAVGWVAATQSDSYATRVSTTVDSTASGTNWSVYLITTHTTVPTNWFVGHPDSGYSVDNIAPSVPQNFAVAYNSGFGNALSWDPATEFDFQFYRVYRSTDPGFIPTAGDLAHETATPGWTDPDFDGWSVYYKVTTLDYAGNESDPASAGSVTGAGPPDHPTRYALHAAAPNPFNPMTQVRYDVPFDGETMTIRVFDVGGRQVRTLVEGPQSAGAKSVTWNGRDDRGRAAASGVYFYQMRAGSFVETRKMVLLK